MVIAFGIVSIVLLLIVGYFLMIHPFVCIMECAVSKQFSGGKKAMWIVITFLTGILGSAIYTLFVSQSPKLRSSSKIMFGIGALSFALTACLGFLSSDVKAFLSQRSGMEALAMEDVGDTETELPIDGDFSEKLKQLEKLGEEFDELIKESEAEQEDAAGDATFDVMSESEAGLDEAASLEATWETEELLDAGTAEEAAAEVFVSTEPAEQYQQSNSPSEEAGGLNSILDFFSSPKSEDTNFESNVQSSSPARNPFAAKKVNEAPIQKRTKARSQPSSAATPPTRPTTQVSRPLRNRYLEENPYQRVHVPPPSPIRNRYTGQ